jgi:hypothetical protein
MTAQHGFTKAFIYSTSALLFITGAAKLYSATGTVKILTATNPFFHLSYRSLMVGVGLVELAIAAYLLRGDSTKLKLWLVLWLSSNFIMYRVAASFLQIRPCPCLGTLQSTLPFSKDLVDFVLKLVVVYFFVGSAGTLLAWFSGNQDRRPFAA